MTQPRDPIEDWLGTDVELMPPRPGGFERVHRNARRRRTMRAAGTIAGAAVVVVAVAIAPQLAGSLLRHGPGPSRIANGSTSPTPSRTSPEQSQAAGFRPTSVTFVDQKHGAVIGQGGTVAATSDYGVHWTRLGSVGGQARVSQIRLLDGVNGWAFGPDLYATHDGGATWKRISLPGNVVDLATVAHRAFAVVARGSGAFTLYSALATTAGIWQKVTGAASNNAEQPGGLQLTGQYGYLLAAGRLLAGPVTGGAWHQVPVSASMRACLSGPIPALLAPAPDGRLFLACGTPLTSYVSMDGGRAWQRLGVINVSGRANSLAVAPTSDALVLATSRGLYYSAHGRTWQAVPGLPGGFRFVGMTFQFLGVAVPTNAGLHEIFTTADGGLHWRPTRIQP